MLLTGSERERELYDTEVGPELCANPTFAATVGSEELTNGSFTTDTDWTKGAGWTIAGGVAAGTGPSGSVLSQEPTLIEGDTYRITFDVVTRTAGAVTPRVQGVVGDSVTAVGSYTQYIVAGASGTTGMNKNAAFEGSVDNISVRRLTAMDEYTLTLGWVYYPVAESITGPSTGHIRQNDVGLIQGATYLTNYTISGYVDGTYNLVLYGELTATGGTGRTADGTYQDVITVGDTVSTVSDQFRFNTPTDGTATLNGLSIRRQTSNASIAGESIQDAEKRWLLAAGATAGGAIDDMWREVLTAAGYVTNSLADQKRAFADADYSLYTFTD